MLLSEITKNTIHYQLSLITKNNISFYINNRATDDETNTVLEYIKDKLIATGYEAYTDFLEILENDKDFIYISKEAEIYKNEYLC